MNILKLLAIVSVALAIMTFGSDIGEWLSIPGSESFVDCRGQGRSSAHAGKRCRSSTTDGAALRRWCL